MQFNVKKKIWLPDDWKNSILKEEFVLHVLEPEPEGEIGGADMHVYNLALQQKRNSFLRPIVLINQNNRYSEILKQAGVPHICCNLLPGKKLRILPYLKDLPSLINIKLLHSHQYDANYITFLLKKFFPNTWGKIPTVMTCHGWIENTLKDKAKTVLDFYTYNFADAIITACEKDEKRLEKFKNRKYIKYIPNGIFPLEAKFNSEVNKFKNKFSIPFNKKIVGIVGRLAIEKGIDIFLKACHEVIQEEPNVCFIIVGSGPEDKRLKKLCQYLNLSHDVIFTGIVYEIDIVFSAIDILVLASNTESTPRVVIEAMSLGKSVIATEVGGVSHIIEHKVNGLLVKKGDYSAIARSILFLLKNDNINVQLCKSAKETVLRKFTISKMQENIDTVYKHIL